MPRTMAAMDVTFGKEVDSAVRLAKSAETVLIEVRAPAGHAYHRLMHKTQIEYIYELAFLKIFISWEGFLEAALLRYLCGHHSPRFGRAALSSGSKYCRDLKAAEAVMLAFKGGKKPYDYIHWGNTNIATQVARTLLTSSRLETVLNGAKSDLDDFCRIRNRIAHGQPDAIKKFNDAAMRLAKHRGFDNKAGRFLRAFDTSGKSHLHWIESIGSKLKKYAAAIV